MTLTKTDIAERIGEVTDELLALHAVTLTPGVTADDMGPKLHKSIEHLHDLAEEIYKEIEG